jgi:hypothetical protein
MVQSRTARCAFQKPLSIGRIAILAEIIACGQEPGPISTGNHRSSRPASIVDLDRFRTTDVRFSALNV